MFLPDPQRRGEIHFWFAPALPYNRRLLIAAACLVAGFTLQTILPNPLVGAGLLLAATLLTLVKGYTNQPSSAKGKREWRAADPAQLRKILDIADRAKSWDQSAIDITCGTGCATLLLVAVPLILLAAHLLQRYSDAWLSTLLVADAAALLLPHWITGVRTILTNAPLTVRVQKLLYVHKLWEEDKRPNETLSAQIEVQSADKGELPVDAKLILQLTPLNNDFLGVQVQVTLNNVQGTDYPYLYCVLVARPALNMLQRLKPKPPSGIITEWQHDHDMDILVVRQATSKTSGYHTKDPVIARIFLYARDLAHQLL